MFHRLNSWWRNANKRPLRLLLQAHLEKPSESAQTINHTIKPVDRINLQLTLDRWLTESGGTGRLLGFTQQNGFFHGPTLAELLRADDVFQGPVERGEFEQRPNEMLDCVVNGVYLLHHDQQPILLLIRRGTSMFDQSSLEILAHERASAQSSMKKLLEEAQQGNIYKGRTIYLESIDYPAEIHIRFRDVPDTPREAIILPEAILAVIERNVIGLFRHGEVLRRAGRSTRHGVLFHGPPGTGKSLVLRYLVRACPEHTVILMTGRQVGLIRESCHMARLLAPSLVLLEDIDLVAQERSQNNCPTILHELMDEMDGLGPRAEVVFLLTTNRPEVLEPALASRPGRIDQAVEFPLPDADCRRRLFALYGQGLDLARIDLERWVDKTDGVSPAFIEEWFRKAALLAAERGETAAPLPIQDADLEKALSELVFFGGELTQRLLGYRPAIGYRSPGSRSG
jgi:hypothetical protein